MAHQSLPSGLADVGSDTNEEKESDSGNSKCQHAINEVACSLSESSDCIHGEPYQGTASNETVQLEVNAQKEHCKQVNIRRLDILFKSLHDEIMVLETCLVEKGILHAAEVSSKLHKQNWSMVREATGWSGDACIGDVMKPQELTSLMVHHVGPEALSTYRATSREAHALIDAVSMKLYVCGGGISSDQAWRSVERFDLQRGIWERLLDMQVGRFNSAAAVLEGQVYVCGTAGPFGAVVQRLRRNEPGWDSLTSMSMPLFGHAVAGFNNCLYVCGGYTTGGKSSSSVQRLVLRNPFDKGTWESVGPMLEPRGDCAMVAFSGHLFVCGGCEVDGFPKLSVEHCRPREVPDEASWASLSPMLMARQAHRAVTLRSKVFVSGGLGNELAVL